MILPRGGARKSANNFYKTKFNIRVFSVASNYWFGALSNIRICGESFRPRHIKTTIATNSRFRKRLGIGVAESAAMARKSDAMPKGLEPYRTKKALAISCRIIGYVSAAKGRTGIRAKFVIVEGG